MKTRTKESARAEVQAELDRRSRIPGDRFVVVDRGTLERSFGWVFFYNSEKYLETSEVKFAIAGDGPVIVNKETGEIKFCGSQKRAEDWISEYVAAQAETQRRPGGAA